MRAIGFFSLCVIVLVAGVAVLEQRRFDATRQTSMGAIDPTKVTLGPAPINPAWIIEGHPKTEAAEIAHTDDATTKVYVWQTSASRFHWFYDADEVVTVLDGEVFVADDGGPEHRLGPGDVAFFPAGARTSWRVPDHLRKIATLKRPLPTPIETAMRWLRDGKAMLKPTQAQAFN